ncbi:jg22387 [Pararge aegeria aegeria]|uniref:Jg22387 protein n=1 Tax=Pararge aegeria aegeria TaxID=348720 RepID=A0A8S4QN99_9NEOP|nr:jg22387 [Pararge aegeria aegeria]
MSGKLNKFETPSSASSDSDSELALELNEQVFLDEDDYTRAPASPTTVPNVRPYRPPSTGSNIMKSPRARRVRTTSMSQSNKRTTAESILHADRRTIYTAGRPPWYNCTGGQEVEPFLIGKTLHKT